MHATSPPRATQRRRPAGDEIYGAPIGCRPLVLTHRTSARPEDTRTASRTSRSHAVLGASGVLRPRGQARTYGSRGGRSRAGLRLPVAALRRGVHGHARGLRGQGRRPAGRVHRQDQVRRSLTPAVASSRPRAGPRSARNDDARRLVSHRRGCWSEPLPPAALPLANMAPHCTRLPETCRVRA